MKLLGPGDDRAGHGRTNTEVASGMEAEGSQSGQGQPLTVRRVEAAVLQLSVQNSRPDPPNSGRWRDECEALLEVAVRRDPRERLTDTLARPRGERIRESA